MAMPWLLSAPFHGDDYVFLDRVSRPTFHFADAWSRASHFSGWYRPWSRELHFLALQRVFGFSETAFHVANAALWVGVLGLYGLVARRLAGPAAARLALLGAGAAAVWLVPLSWASGSQDLWMLLFLMASLLAWVAERPVLAGLLLAPALLSKESAIVGPLLFAGWSLIVRRHPIGRTIGRLGPALLVTAAWIWIHPTLLARVLAPGSAGPPGEAAAPSVALAALSLIAPFNIDRFSAAWLSRSLELNRHGIAAVVLLGLAVWSWRIRERGGSQGSPPGTGAQIAFAGSWWVVGTLPILVGIVGWHSYYAAPAVFGAWLVVAGIARRWPAAAFAVLLIAIGARAPRLTTPDWDWGAFPAEERAGRLNRQLVATLLRRLPSPGGHSRLFFRNVPRNVGFVTSDGPLFRIVYGDTTLRAGFWGEYAPRGPDEPAGTDYFISYATLDRWDVVRPGDASPAPDRPAAAWESDHRDLALTFGRARDWRNAVAELELLLRFRPDHEEYRLNRDYCERRAADRPGEPPGRPGSRGRDEDR